MPPVTATPVGRFQSHNAGRPTALPPWATTTYPRPLSRDKDAGGAGADSLPSCLGLTHYVAAVNATARARVEVFDVCSRADPHVQIPPPWRAPRELPDQSK